MTKLAEGIMVDLESGDAKTIHPVRIPIKIDKNVAMPLKRTYVGMFPFDNMEIGDSFSIGAEHGAQIYQAMSHHHKRKGAKRFTTKKRLENNIWVYRCWRIE